MLRSLIVRQVFVLVDLFLALLVAFVAYLVIAKLAANNPGKETAAVDARVEASEIVIPEPMPREAYDLIVTSKLFGEGAAESGAGVVEAPPPMVEAVVTTLPLKLVGTAATGGPTDPLASATIENTAASSGGYKQQRVYYLQDEIMPGVNLLEVHKRRVLLENKGSNRREWLSMDEEELAASATDLAPADAAIPPEAGARPVVKKEELAQLAVNYMDILNAIQIEEHKTDGVVDGFTAKNFDQHPMAQQFAQKLGLQDNDVLQQVNGMALDSTQKIVEAATKFQNVKTFRLTILRGGKPQVISFNME